LADDGAKDASRVSYAPVVRPGTVYRFREVDGAPLDARAVLAKQPPAPMRAPLCLPAHEHIDAYVRAALRRAASNVTTSDPGSRHHTLLREAFALARFNLSHEEIERVLLPAFVTTAGEARRREGERAIRDAVRARRGAQ
jgi:hypothetical protein